MSEPEYFYNKDSDKKQTYITSRMRVLEEYHYITTYQGKQIIENTESNILSDLPIPLLDHIVNLAGDPVSRTKAISKAIPFDEVPASGIYSWASGFKLVTVQDCPIFSKPSIDYWLPYGSQ